MKIRKNVSEISHYADIWRGTLKEIEGEAKNWNSSERVIFRLLHAESQYMLVHSALLTCGVTLGNCTKGIVFI